jgi:hypothetical protein
MTPNPWLMLLLALLHPLSLLLPFYLSGAFTLAWRRSLAHPWRFFVLGAVVLLALYMSLGVYFAPVVTFRATVELVNPSGGVAPPAPTSLRLPSWWFEYRAPIIVILASFPLLSLIRRMTAGTGR